ncbi:SDR family NAD(P)-dependent oxidoreductase [Streptomyces sp. PA03-5A]|nr:SDR family NAD(P)-dependent oxidoreductase [Streptomyces sp. PA03-5A]
MDLGCRDHVHLLTGGSRGLGRAVAEVLTAEGARVVTGRSAASVADAARDLGGDARVVGVVADNADPGSADEFVGAALRHVGRLDGALASAGGPPAGAVMDVADQVWRDAFESTFLGAVRIARAAANAFTGEGSLAFVLSSSVREPIPGLAVSNGPGLAMVAKTLADELGGSGTRVNGLLPAHIDTDRARGPAVPTGVMLPVDGGDLRAL